VNNTQKILVTLLIFSGWAAFGYAMRCSPGLADIPVPNREACFR